MAENSETPKRGLASQFFAQICGPLSIIIACGLPGQYCIQFPLLSYSYPPTWMLASIA